MPRYRSSVGITSSRSDVQQRKASLPIRCSFGGSHMSAKATQCAKVEFQMAVISVHMRLTSTSRLQFSQAFGPMLRKSHGRQRLSMPAPQKLPSGSVRDLLVLSVAKLINVSVRQLSKAKGPSCAPGARSLVVSMLLPMPTLERAALGKNSSAELNTPRGHDLLEDIAALENSIVKADDRKW